MRQLMMCRATGTHAWVLVPPIVIVPNGKRVLLHCERCASWRIDLWGKAGSIDGRTYERQREYQAYIKERQRPDARVDILGSDFKEVSDATDHPHLRLVQGRGNKTKAKARFGRGHAHLAKRRIG